MPVSAVQPAAESAPKRGRPPSLTRRQVVAVALDVARQTGAASVSLRLVAERLGVHQTSLYTYVANKSELMRAMLDQAIAERVPLPAADDPRPAAEQLLEIFVALRDLAAEQSELLALVGRTGANAHGPLDAVDAVFALLTRLGLDAIGQMQVYNLLYHQTVASALLTGNRARAAAEGEGPPRALGVDAVDAAAYPHLAGLVRALPPDVAAAISFEAAVRTILTVVVPALASARVGDA